MAMASHRMYVTAVRIVQLCKHPISVFPDLFTGLACLLSCYLPWFAGHYKVAAASCSRACWDFLWRHGIHGGHDMTINEPVDFGCSEK